MANGETAHVCLQAFRSCGVHREMQPKTRGCPPRTGGGSVSAATPATNEVAARSDALTTHRCTAVKHLYRRDKVVKKDFAGGKTMRLVLTFLLLCGLSFAQAQSSGNTVNAQMAMRPGPNADQDRIAKEVRHELVMLPYYSIFDDLEFTVNGDTVTLLGSVTRPTLKSDAENVVKKVEGVNKVDNQIKVLPPSPNDDRIRMEVARAISRQSSLYRYFMGAVGSIHIIVDNGHVTLKGFVDSQADNTQAKLAANQVPGVFSVTDDLQVTNQKER